MIIRISLIFSFIFSWDNKDKEKSELCHMLLLAGFSQVATNRGAYDEISTD
jgi:hypothetical protein